MKARTMTLGVAALLNAGGLVASGAAAPLAAQTDTIPESMRARTLPRQHLAGPRFGFTAFTGEVADQRRAVGESRMMSQFGWQFETQIVSTSTGGQALMEWVFLLGGFEQDMRSFSMSWLAGYRLPNRFEFGVGPNLGFPLDGPGDMTTSIVTAVGSSVPFGDIHVPLNMAVAWAPGGPRITALAGWIVG